MHNESVFFHLFSILIFNLPLTIQFSLDFLEVLRQQSNKPHQKRSDSDANEILFECLFFEVM